MEQAVEEAVAAGDAGDGGVVELAMSVCFLQVETRDSKTYIENDEEDDIDAVENNKDAKEPPIGTAREQKRKAASRMVEQKSKLLPDAAAERNGLGCHPNDESKHARKARIADDD